MDATGVLGVLGLFEEGIHILEDDGLLALFLLTSNLDNGLHGGVQVASADEISNVETIDLAISLEVIDLKGELDFCKDLTNNLSTYTLNFCKLVSNLIDFYCDKSVECLSRIMHCILVYIVEWAIKDF